MNDYYRTAAPRLIECGDAAIALRSYGTGPALLLVHGFPTSSFTWRKVLPALAKSFTCHAVDLPGLGDSRWDEASDLSFTGQVRRLAMLAEQLGLDRFGLLAHDTGATLARHLALALPDRVTRLALINTEIPGHRPPWIPQHQLASALPGAPWIFKALMSSRVFRRSPAGLAGLYYDKTLLDDPEILNAYVRPLTTSTHAVGGALRYLRGIQWNLVDELKSKHSQITAPTLLLWGRDDPTFPVALAAKMAEQFMPPARLVEIGQARLLPHEERPAEVLEGLLPFLKAPLRQ